MKKVMVLKNNQDTFDCPVCKRDNFHRYQQGLYKIHWCDTCNNYYTIEKSSGNSWVCQLNEDERKPDKRNLVNLARQTNKERLEIDTKKWNVYFLKNKDRLNKLRGKLIQMEGSDTTKKPLTRFKTKKHKERVKGEERKKLLKMYKEGKI